MMMGVCGRGWIGWDDVRGDATYESLAQIVRIYGGRVRAGYVMASNMRVVEQAGLRQGEFSRETDWRWLYECMLHHNVHCGYKSDQMKATSIK